MKFLIFYIILLGYIFAEDKTCSEINSKMVDFKYEYLFSTEKDRFSKFNCDVYPSHIYEKLYLLFICSNDRGINSKNFIFAHKCYDEITRISDINRFSVATILQLNSLEINFLYEYSSQTGHLSAARWNKMFGIIPIAGHSLPSNHKEITYLLLTRRGSDIDPIKKLAEYGYDYKNIGETLRLSYQTISSPIIYCKKNIRKGFINEIEFFPPQNEYYFCHDKDLGRDFFKELIMKYNEIIAMDIRLMTKIEKFRSSLTELIEKFQKTYKKRNPNFKLVKSKLNTKRNAPIIDNDVGVSRKKQHIESDTEPTLPHELEHTPFNTDVGVSGKSHHLKSDTEPTLPHELEHTPFNTDVGVSGKSHHLESHTEPTLPHELEYTPFDGDANEIYPDLQR